MKREIKCQICCSFGKFSLTLGFFVFVFSLLVLVKKIAFDFSIDFDGVNVLDPQYFHAYCEKIKVF